MIKDWNRQQIEQEIWKIKFAATDPRMDGFVTWGCKQDLIRLKYLIEDALEDCSTYVGEQEFIDQLEAERTFRALKKTHA